MTNPDELKLAEKEKKIKVVESAWDQEFFARQDIAKRMARACPDAFLAAYYLPWHDEEGDWLRKNGLFGNWTQREWR